MKYTLIFSKKAIKDIDKLKNNKKLLKKVVEIIEDLTINPFSETNKFERLVGNYSGFCSRRIDLKNRIIYKVDGVEVTVVVVSVLGHYNDK